MHLSSLPEPMGSGSNNNAASIATNRQVLAFFWKVARPHRVGIFVVVVMVVLGSLGDLLVPIAFKYLIDAMREGAIHAVLMQAFLWVVGAKFFVWAVNRIREFVVIEWESRVMVSLQEVVAEYLLHHSFQYFTDAFAGSLVRKVSRISRSFEVFVDEFEVKLIPVSVGVIGATTLLTWRFPLLGLAFLGWVILFLVINIRHALWKRRTIDVARSDADSRAVATLADTLSNVSNVKYFATERREALRFKEAIGGWGTLLHRSWFVGVRSNLLQLGLTLVLEVVLMWYGVVLWERGVMTVGDLVFLQGVLLVVFARIVDVGRSLRKLMEAFADAADSVSILQVPHSVQDASRAKTLTAKKGAIEFRDVTFGYAGNKPVLRDFSMSISSREKVALVGHSGAGKSTISKLLLRLYDIQKGTISIDGTDISTVKQQSLREVIAYVPQEPALFHRTLTDNIRYARPDATDAQVRRAARLAHCDEFIARLPQGYDTYVGERGVKLSGGERQRVAIARAILKDAPIVLFDEATSSLDSESEQLIQAALDDLMRNKTTIVIAHRLSTIAHMDRIVVVEDGQVRAMGNHKELYAQDERYRTLWDIQAGGFAAE